VISNIDLQQALPDTLQALAFAGSATLENWLQTLSQYGDSWIKRIDQISALGLGVCLKGKTAPAPP